MPGPLSSLSVELIACDELALQRWRHEIIALPCWRLYWNARAGSEVRFAGCSWKLGPTCLVLIAPNTIYTAHDGGLPSQHLYVHFAVRGIEWQPPQGVCRQVVSATEQSLIQALRLRLDGESACEGSLDEIRFAAVSLCTHALLSVPVDWRQKTRIHPIIQKSLNYLEKNIDCHVPNQVLADRVAMHVNAFTRLFRQSTGLSPQAWHHRYRIEQAGLELVRSDASIETIAETFGYYDRHHFSRVFKRIRGQGPAAWRRAASCANMCDAKRGVIMSE